MSLASPSSRNDYTGNGSVSSYSYTFKIFLATDLSVEVTDTASPPVEIALVKDVDYTVSGVGSSSGGAITLISAGQSWLTTGNLKNGYKLIIRRIRALTQTTDIRNQGAFFPEIHEDTFDEIVMLCQQMQEQIDRCFKLPVNLLPSVFSPNLPGSITAAGSTFEIGPAGDRIIMIPPVGGATGVFGTPIQEVPTGLVNSSNKIFTLSNTPISNASVSVFQNRLILIQGVDYTIAGAVVTLTSAPAFGQGIYAVYQH